MCRVIASIFITLAALIILIASVTLLATRHNEVMTIKDKQNSAVIGAVAGALVQVSGFVLCLLADTQQRRYIVLISMQVALVLSVTSFALALKDFTSIEQVKAGFKLLNSASKGVAKIADSPGTGIVQVFKDVAKDTMQVVKDVAKDTMSRVVVCILFGFIFLQKSLEEGKNEKIKFGPTATLIIMAAAAGVSSVLQIIAIIIICTLRPTINPEVTMEMPKMVV